MTNKKIKALGIAGVTMFGIYAAMSLVMSVFLYFEIMGMTSVSKVLYGMFVVTLLLFSFLCARIVEVRGLFVGLALGLGFVFLSLLYRIIGVGNGISMTFMIRSGIVMLVAVSGAVVGVNTVRR